MNYFLYLKLSAYLVYGWALPEGKTTWVLTIEEDDVKRLWNPSFVFFFFLLFLISILLLLTL